MNDVKFYVFIDTINERIYNPVTKNYWGLSSGERDEYLLVTDEHIIIADGDIPPENENGDYPLPLNKYGGFVLNDKEYFNIRLCFDLSNEFMDKNDFRDPPSNSVSMEFLENLFNFLECNPSEFRFATFSIIENELDLLKICVHQLKFYVKFKENLPLNELINNITPERIKDIINHRHTIFEFNQETYIVYKPKSKKV